mmetsp:Transcript_10580/g.25065  ORF Transcript_10580/g.25065 Transcript_10580/m.25065 type:complete len:255 (-) Transcript_10580:515-1279(-)
MWLSLLSSSGLTVAHALRSAALPPSSSSSCKPATLTGSSSSSSASASVSSVSLGSILTLVSGERFAFSLSHFSIAQRSYTFPSPARTGSLIASIVSGHSPHRFARSASRSPRGVFLSRSDGRSNASPVPILASAFPAERNIASSLAANRANTPAGLLLENFGEDRQWTFDFVLVSQVRPSDEIRPKVLNAVPRGVTRSGSFHPALEAGGEVTGQGVCSKVPPSLQNFSSRRGTCGFPVFSLTCFCSRNSLSLAS